MNIKIGAKIKALRKRDDITQERLAEVLGVTSQAISKWESESGYPDIEYMTPIANFFNVTIDYLFDHDTAEKRRKIEEYCEQYDAHYREWKPFQERIDMMRKALAEFPGEEKLLVRLATALWYKWCDQSMEHGSGEWINGKWVHNFEKCKSFIIWEEAAKIFEELLATSIDDSIRSECRHLLAYIYGGIGEKEKVLALAEKCPDCKYETLVWALNDRYDDAEMYQQRLAIGAISSLRKHFIAVAEKTKDLDIKIEALNKVIDLYKFYFSDGNCGFYHVFIDGLYSMCAEALVRQNKFDEAFEALENTYYHVKQFDIYLDKIRKEGKFQYTSPFLNLSPDYANEIHAVKQLPEFLNRQLKDEYDIFYKNLRDDPRYIALINKIEAEI